MKTLILGILILAGSCGSQKIKAKDTNIQELDKNPLTLILSDNYGGAETEQLLVLRDEKSLIRFFSKVNMTRKPGLQIPDIDFSTEMVVIYCNGQTTDKNIPKLNKLEDKEDKMVLSLLRESIQEKSPDTAVLMPFHLFKMPLTEKEIVLQDK